MPNEQSTHKRNSSYVCFERDGSHAEGIGLEGGLKRSKEVHGLAHETEKGSQYHSQDRDRSHKKRRKHKQNALCRNVRTPSAKVIDVDDKAGFALFDKVLDCFLVNRFILRKKRE